ncbi:cystein proteinase inhibitor protein salarin [Leptinotarsa decemlineata]|uniref:cystein proteinase inhibitor protein salarin n=1 Tax=Leptinotarsa decemlineata TaxID=7539 RepID=UPI003D3048B9
MKITLLLFVVFSVFITTNTFSLSVDEQWSSFKVSHGKSYANKEEEAKRRAIFETHLREVEEHNRKYDNGEVTWRMAINRFSDLTPEEMKIYNGVRRTPKGGLATFAYFQIINVVEIMKITVLLLVVLSVVMATQLSVEEQWKNFKSEHGKSYPTPEEETRRFEIFKNNLNKIREHNERYDAGEESYFMGINQFADLTDEEFRNQNLGLEEEQDEAHGKSYENEEEEATRRAIFETNLQKIEEHNKKYDNGEVTWKMGINKFADLTPDEMKKFTGARKLKPDGLATVA